jgi:hypothetical protein
MKKLFILGTLCLLVTITAVSQSKKDWEKVQSLNSWNVYQQFIISYPNGKYTEQAKQKQSLLKQPETVKTVEAEVPVEKSTVVGPVVASQTNEQIELKKKRYYQNDKKLTNKDLKSILLSDPESAVEYEIAKKNSTIAAVPATIGAALCLYGAAVSLKQSVDESNAISDGNLYYQSDQSKFVTPILVGAGLVVVAIPFMISSNNHLKKSVTIYNSKKSSTGYRDEMKLDFGITQTGVGVTYHF